MTSLASSIARIGCVCALALSASPASAELQDDVAALQLAWQKHGTVRVLSPELLTQGTVVPLKVPPSAGEGACTNVAILAALSTGFVVRFAAPDRAMPWHTVETPEIAVGGTAQIVRCGKHRKALDRLLIEMRSPRGVVQVVVGYSSNPLPPVRDLLPHREPGAIAGNTQIGPRPPTAPVSERAAALLARFERERADDVHRRLIPTDESGSARVLFELEPGCHQFVVMGVPPNEQVNAQAHDVDAELVWPDVRAVAASDRSDSPDAALSACVGERREAVLALAGGAARGAVLVGYARWALPPELPERWGPRVRAGFAQAFRSRKLHPSTDPPVYETLGISGTTLLPLETEPGACYTLAVTPLHGNANLIVASVAARGTGALAHGADGEPALVTFCTDATRATAEIEAHGESLGWVAALWQTGRTPLGVPSP